MIHLHWYDTFTSVSSLRLMPRFTHSNHYTALWYVCWRLCWGFHARFLGANFKCEVTAFLVSISQSLQIESLQACPNIHNQCGWSNDMERSVCVHGKRKIIEMECLHEEIRVQNQVHRQSFQSKDGPSDLAVCPPKHPQSSITKKDGEVKISVPHSESSADKRFSKKAQKWDSFS